MVKKTRKTKKKRAGYDFDKLLRKIWGLSTTKKRKKKKPRR